MNTFPHNARSISAESYVQLHFTDTREVNLNIFALVDSGASVSIINRNLLDHVRYKLEPCNMQLNGVSGSTLKVLGKTRLPFTIGSCTIEHEFIVVDSMMETLILGRDIFRDHNCIINYSKLTFSIHDSEVPLLKISKSNAKNKTAPLSVKAKSSMVIKPNTSKFVPVSLHSKKGKTFLSISGIFEGHSQLNRKSIQVAPSLTNFSKGTAYIEVANTLDHDIYVYKNQKMGSLSLCSKEAVLSNNVASTEHCDPNQPTPGTSTEQHPKKWGDNIETLFAKLGINELDHLSSAELAQVKALVTKFQGIFAVSDDDLGCTDIAQHKIILNSDRPVRCKYRPIPLSHREPAEKEIQRLIDLKIIEPSSSTYHSPAFLKKRFQMEGCL